METAGGGTSRSVSALSRCNDYDRAISRERFPDLNFLPPREGRTTLIFKGRRKSTQAQGAESQDSSEKPVDKSQTHQTEFGEQDP